MATTKERVNWINKYMLDMMNSTERSVLEAKQQEIERYSKKLLIDSLGVIEHQKVTNVEWKSGKKLMSREMLQVERVLCKIYF